MLNNPSFTAGSPKLAEVHPTLTAAFEDGDGLVPSKGVERQLVETVQSIYEFLAGGDVDRFLSHFADDIVADLYIPAEFHFRTHAEGKAGFRDLVLDNFQLLEAQAPRVTGVIAQGDTVVVMAHESGIVRATRVPYAIQMCQCFKFRDGKVCQFTEIGALE